jgi:hypothetical protein
MTRFLICRSFALALFSLLLAKGAEKCDPLRGQLFIDSGQYDRAIREFTCVIDREPTAVEGYRGRIEAALLLGHYSDAVRDYAGIIAYVLPVHPDAKSVMLDSYAARLAVSPNSIPALTGQSSVHWWFFEYQHATHVLNRLLDIAPNDVYGNLFRGSCRMLSGASRAQGAADVERAILLDPANPHVHFIAADAYTYGVPDPTRAFAEASLALNGGVDTPRVHAILSTVYQAFGNQPAAAAEIKIHLDQVTTQLLVTPASLAAGGSLSLPLVPGRTYEIPLAVTAGQTLNIATSSRDFYDTILVLLGPDGTPVIGSDDTIKYFAALDWVAPVSGNYRMLVSSFESVNTGELLVTRK